MRYFLERNRNLKIGNKEFNNNVFLAPMAGITDKPFRKICRKFGAGMVYSEMISAKGLYYNDKNFKHKEEPPHRFSLSHKLHMLWYMMATRGGVLHTLS